METSRKEEVKSKFTLSDASVCCRVQILDEVERRRGVSAALVYPFMRSLMESPFPAPGKIIKVKTFLPGAGNEVRNDAAEMMISLAPRLHRFGA